MESKYQKKVVLSTKDSKKLKEKQQVKEQTFKKLQKQSQEIESLLKKLIMEVSSLEEHSISESQLRDAYDKVKRATKYLQAER